MPAYDSNLFQPPAPLAMVTVRSPSAAARIANVPVLLDSGADVSLLPRGHIETLIASVEVSSRYELEAFDGTRSLADAVQLEVLFLGKSFRGQFVVMDGRYGVLGRNVLNSISLSLDGPSLTWTENR